MDKDLRQTGIDIREKKAKEFGKKLQKIMEKQHISQNMLAKKISINRSSINKYLNGESTPRIDTFLMICEVLKVEPNYFFETKFCDYQADDSKSDERKLIESLFYLFDAGILVNVKDVNYFEYVYIVDFSNYSTIYKVCDECNRYAHSDLVIDTQISSKIVEKYESQLKEEKEQKMMALNTDEIPF